MNDVIIIDKEHLLVVFGCSVALYNAWIIANKLLPNQKIIFQPLKVLNFLIIEDFDNSEITLAHVSVNLSKLDTRWFPIGVC